MCEFIIIYIGTSFTVFKHCLLFNKNWGIKTKYYLIAIKVYKISWVSYAYLYLKSVTKLNVKILAWATTTD